jgi:hypothetical protein
MPQGEGWGEGRVDQRRTSAENESEERDPFSRERALGIAHAQNNPRERLSSGSNSDFRCFGSAMTMS